ncbi:MAG: sigma-70 family RNA polymerase sigma factor [Candidatus Alcyoniella australis]|nr:sigma-70 family RNA polymerase sigma factor [Candidatus Alcyoniella australis]
MTKLPDLTDAVARAQAGEHEAFEQIVRDYTAFVYRTALSVTKDPAEADEVVQSTFVRVYRKLHTFSGRSAFSTWLYRITVNQARNRLRDRARHQGMELDKARLSVEDHTAEQLDHDRRRRMLYQALDELPEIQGQVARLRLAEELPFAQIGEALGITQNAAKVNFHHAVRKLKERLAQ